MNISAWMTVLSWSREHREQNRRNSIRRKQTRHGAQKTWGRDSDDSSSCVLWKGWRKRDRACNSTTRVEATLSHARRQIMLQRTTEWDARKASSPCLLPLLLKCWHPKIVFNISTLSYQPFQIWTLRQTRMVQDSRNHERQQSVWLKRKEDENCIYTFCKCDLVLMLDYDPL